MRTAFLFSPLLLLWSCGSLRTVKVPPAPGPIPARIPEQVSVAPAPRQPLPDPPPLPADTTSEPEQPVVAIELDLPSTPKPIPPKRPPKAIAKQKPAFTAPPAPVASTEVSEGAPMIQLGQLVPAAERSELLREIEELLAYCEHSMEVASRHSLTAAQSELLHRIRSLSHQSRELRERNPVEAKNLAERAKLFAGGLLMDLQ